MTVRGIGFTFETSGPLQFAQGHAPSGSPHGGEFTKGAGGKAANRISPELEKSIGSYVQSIAKDRSASTPFKVSLSEVHKESSGVSASRSLGVFEGVAKDFKDGSKLNLGQLERSPSRQDDRIEVRVTAGKVGLSQTFGRAGSIGTSNTGFKQ